MKQLIISISIERTVNNSNNAVIKAIICAYIWKYYKISVHNLSILFYNYIQNNNITLNVKKNWR